MTAKGVFVKVCLLVIYGTFLHFTGSWILQKDVEVFRNRQWYSGTKNMTKPAIVVETQRWHTTRSPPSPSVKYKKVIATNNSSTITTAKALKCRPIKFADPPLPITALVSFPGSGNTWFRHLLEVASGIYTGSVYNDTALMDGGFRGENITNGSVIVVKTHSAFGLVRPRVHKLKDVKRVILLIRDPVNASMAELNRRFAGHTGVANQDKITKVFPRFLQKAVPKRNATYRSWLNVANQLMVVYYERLKTNLLGEMSRVFRFLNVSVSDEDLNCMTKNSQGKFRRTVKRKPPVKLSESMTKYVYETEKSLLKILQKHSK